MRSHLDDYLYDVARTGRGVELSNEDIEMIIDNIMTIAENNHTLYGA